MRPPTHLHDSAGLLVATVLVLLGSVGLVQAQSGQPPSPPSVVAPARPAVDPVLEHVSRRRPNGALPPIITTTTTSTSTPTVPPTIAPVAETVPPAPRTATTAPQPVTTTPPPAAVALPSDGPAYAQALLREVIPARWLSALPVRVEVIPGQTSWSTWGGLIQIGEWHLFHTVARARNTLAHEWAHQVAWHYGTDAYNGAPPAGFPYSGRSPEEQFADCVAEVLTGTSYPSAGLGACPAEARSFTQQYLAAGPGPRLR